MKDYFLVFLGGGLGAAARYWVSGIVYRWLSTDFPYGNLAVNGSACLLIGFFSTALSDRFLISPSLRIFLTVGILGGYSTFSSFSYETVALLHDGEILRASINVVSSVGGCLLATIGGMFLGKLV